MEKIKDSDNGRKSLAVKWGVSLGIPAVIALIPCSEVYTPEIKSFLAITAAAIFICAFELMNNLMLGILMPFAYNLFKTAPAEAVYSGWTGTVPYITLACLVLAVILEECGLLKRISLFCINKTGGSYRGVCFGLLISGIICSLITGCSVQFVWAALAYGVCRTLKLKPSLAAGGVMLSAAMGTATVNAMVPHPMYMGMLTSLASTPEDPVTCGWTEWFLYIAPGILFLIAYLWFMLKFVVKKVELEAKEEFEHQYKELGPVTKNEKKALVVLVVMLLFLATSQLTGIDTSLPILIAPWLFFLPGFNMADGDTVKKVNLGMVFLTAGFLSVGSVASAVGIDKFITDAIVPLFEGAGIIEVVILTFLFGLLLNFIFTPLGYFSAFTSAIAALYRGLNMNVLISFFVLLYTMDAIVFPYENTAYLVYFGFGMFSLKDFGKLYAPKIPFTLIFIILVMIPWWKLMGLA